MCQYDIWAIYIVILNGSMNLSFNSWHYQEPSFSSIFNIGVTLSYIVMFNGSMIFELFILWFFRMVWAADELVNWSDYGLSSYFRLKFLYYASFVQVDCLKLLTAKQLMVLLLFFVWNLNIWWKLFEPGCERVKTSYTTSRDLASWTN